MLLINLIFFGQKSPDLGKKIGFSNHHIKHEGVHILEEINLHLLVKFSPVFIAILGSVPQIILNGKWE